MGSIRGNPRMLYKSHKVTWSKSFYVTTKYSLNKAGLDTWLTSSKSDGEELFTTKKQQVTGNLKERIEIIEPACA